jgi:ankyrin repeat protein
LFNVDLNIKKHDGTTILHDLMKFGKIESLQFFLNLEIFDEKKKLKLNLKDVNGNTPLFNGVIEGRTEHVATLLKENDVSVNLRNEKDMNIFHSAAYFGRDSMIELLANHEKTKKLLTETNKIGYTPLHVAAKSNSISCVVKLLQIGVDINAQDENGDTPLHLAIKKNSVQSIKNLVFSGAKINIQNKKKESAKKLIIKNKIKL